MTAVHTNQWNQLIQQYTIITVVLLFKSTIVVSCAANSANHPPEDASFNLPPPPQEIKRRDRSMMNDIENLPIHLLVFWLALIVQCFVNMVGQYGTQGTIGLTVLFTIYGAARFFYSIFYGFGLQPFRSISYIIALICVYITAALLLYSAFIFDASKL